MDMGLDFVGSIIKFNSQTAGRDKIFRLFQYGSKFVWWHLLTKGFENDLIDQLKTLEGSISTARKLLRIGKSLDFLHSALKTLHISNNVLRWTLTLSKTNQACYLLFDHLIWAGRTGLLSIDIPKWVQLSSKFWLLSIILNLVRDLYDIWRAMMHEIKIRDNQASKSHYMNGDSNYSGRMMHLPTNLELVEKCIRENLPIFLDFLKNLSDVLLPLSTLGHINTSPGFQGFAGVVSSLVGIATVWDPLLQLVP